MQIALIAVCIAFSAYFSATETAFSTFNRIKMKRQAKEGQKQAALVLKLSADYDRLLSTILIGNNIVNITSASVATALFTDLLGAEIGVSVSTVVMTIAVLIFGEISPKSIANDHADQFSKKSAGLLRVFFYLLYPLNFLFSLWRKFLDLFFKAKTKNEITPYEILAVVDEATQHGSLNTQSGGLIHNVIECSTRRAIDLCTPRSQIVFVTAKMTLEEISETFLSHGYSRLPLCKNTIDDHLGFIHQKDFYRLIHQKEQDITTILTPLPLVSENATSAKLLRFFQKNHAHVALVIDEYGSVEGLVTLEDVLEEIVGEIYDEHDAVTPPIRQISANEFLLDAALSLTEIQNTCTSPSTAAPIPSTAIFVKNSSASPAKTMYAPIWTSPCKSKKPAKNARRKSF